MAEPEPEMTVEEWARDLEIALGYAPDNERRVMLTEALRAAAAEATAKLQTEHEWHAEQAAHWMSMCNLYEADKLPEPARTALARHQIHKRSAERLAAAIREGS